jgi:TatA/E family protein of Tat protein translocase
MFNIGLPELIIILAIALIVFGPNKLPELARAFGKAMREFRKATEEVKESFEAETRDLEDIKDAITDENLLTDLMEDESSNKEGAEEISTKDEGALSPQSSISEEITASQELLKQEGEKKKEIEEPEKGTPPNG